MYGHSRAGVGDFDFRGNLEHPKGWDSGSAAVPQAVETEEESRQAEKAGWHQAESSAEGAASGAAKAATTDENGSLPKAQARQALKYREVTVGEAVTMFKRAQAGELRR
jgi:hypothetical protein